MKSRHLEAHLTLVSRLTRTGIAGSAQAVAGAEYSAAAGSHIDEFVYCCACPNLGADVAPGNGLVDEIVSRYETREHLIRPLERQA
jgi:hypothetical protein